MGQMEIFHYKKVKPHVEPPPENWKPMATTDHLGRFPYPYVPGTVYERIQETAKPGFHMVCSHCQQFAAEGEVMDVIHVPATQIGAFDDDPYRGIPGTGIIELTVHSDVCFYFFQMATYQIYRFGTMYELLNQGYDPNRYRGSQINFWRPNNRDPHTLREREGGWRLIEWAMPVNEGITGGFSRESGNPSDGSLYFPNETEIWLIYPPWMKWASYQHILGPVPEDLWVPEGCELAPNHVTWQNAGEVKH